MVTMIWLQCSPKLRLSVTATATSCPEVIARLARLGDRALPHIRRQQQSYEASLRRFLRAGKAATSPLITSAAQKVAEMRAYLAAVADGDASAAASTTGALGGRSAAAAAAAIAQQRCSAAQIRAARHAKLVAAATDDGVNDDDLKA